MTSMRMIILMRKTKLVIKTGETEMMKLAKMKLVEMIKLVKVKKGKFGRETGIKRKRVKWKKGERKKVKMAKW